MTPEEIQQVAAEAWKILETFSEARYVHTDDEYPYKPFYRMATIFTNSMMGPVHFKVLGLRRHMTEDEAVAVLRAAHPYLARKCDEGTGRENFLILFRDFVDIYDPGYWS